MNRKTAYHRTCTLVGLLVMLGLGVSAPTPIHAAAGNRAHQLSAGPLVPPGGVVVTPQYCVPTASDYDLLHRCVIYMGSTHTPPTISNVQNHNVTPLVTTSSYQSSWTDNWCNAFCYNELFVQTQFDINYNVDSNHTHQITSIYMRESPSWNNGNQLPIFASDHMQAKITDPNGSSPFMADHIFPSREGQI